MASFKEISKGNWQVSFYCKNAMGKNIKYKKLNFKTKNEAKKYYEEFIASNTYSTDLKLIQALNYFKESLGNQKHSTKMSSNCYINKMKNELPNIELYKIEKYMILDYVNRYKDKKYTQRAMIKYLKLFFSFCCTVLKLKENPMNNLKFNLRIERTPRQFLTYEEFVKFDEIINKECGELEILLFNFLYFTGARIGEITGLTFNDVNLEKRNISINKTRIQKNLYNSPKTNSSIRTIQIPNRLVEMLKKYIENKRIIKSEFIFKTPHSYNVVLANIIKKYNLKKFNIHSFRHSHATLLVRKGIEITQITKRLGHSNPNITFSTYSHLYVSDESEVINMLESL